MTAVQGPVTDYDVRARDGWVTHARDLSIFSRNKSRATTIGNGIYTTTIAAGTTVSADRTLTITTGDANRTVNITGIAGADAIYGWDETAGAYEELTKGEAQAVLGLDPSTTVGRLARYSDTTGSQTETTGLFEDGSGNVGIGEVSPSAPLDVAGAMKSQPMLVAALPAAATVGAGAFAFVTDATAVTPRSIVAGGGANFVMVMCDGTDWLIVA